jgi:hypothetical protein
MTTPLQRIQEIQQKKIQAEENQRRALNEKHAREVRAFVTSPVYQMLTAMRNMPLNRRARADMGPQLTSAIRSRPEAVLAGTTSILHMARIGGSPGSVMWRCEELSNGNIRYHVDGIYGFEKNAVGEEGIKLFEDSFVEYVAEILDPAGVTEATGTYVAQGDGARRVIQAIA